MRMIKKYEQIQHKYNTNAKRKFKVPLPPSDVEDFKVQILTQIQIKNRNYDEDDFECEDVNSYAESMYCYEKEYYLSLLIIIMEQDIITFLQQGRNWNTLLTKKAAGSNVARVGYS